MNLGSIQRVAFLHNPMFDLSPSNSVDPGVAKTTGFFSVASGSNFCLEAQVLLQFDEFKDVLKVLGDC